jgi:hypothetical protein
MNMQQAVQSQYLAALKMLKEAIVKCPPSAWDAPQDKDRFWYKAHHTLYWAQVDLRGSLVGFIPWKGRVKPNAGVRISKPELLEYLAFLEQQVEGRRSGTARAASSAARGFRPDKLERAIASIRHIQQHTGELYERLGSRKNVKLRWYEQVRRKSK